MNLHSVRNTILSRTRLPFRHVSFSGIQLVIEIDRLETDFFQSGLIITESRQAIDAMLVFLDAILGYFFRSFVFAPLVEDVSVLLKIVKRHRITAGIRDSVHGQMDKGASADVWWKNLGHFGVTRMFWRDDAGVSMKPNNFRRSVKRAKHNHQALVFVNVSDIFRATARIIKIHNL